jgi:ABC-2 type transport system permease protein
MLMLTSLSVWMVRNQSLMEMWWLFSSLARYPREIFSGGYAVQQLGNFFTFLVPILLVSNVPANVMVRVFDPWMVALTVVSSILLFYLSRRFFLHALGSYRSASS